MATTLREQGPNAIARMRQATTWPVTVALLAVVALFVASTFYSQRVAAELDDDALSIATNASPSIEALSRARGAMLKAEVAAARAIDVTADTGDERDAARDALALMHGSFEKYLAFPFYPGEREHWSELDTTARAFEGEVERCFDAMAHNDRAGALAVLHSRLRPATERLDTAIAYLIAFNASQQHTLGEEIPRLRQHAARMAYVLDAASAMLGVLLVLIVVRESRRRQDLLAHFGERLEQVAASAVRVSGSLERHGEQRAMLETIVEEARRVAGADYAAIGFLQGDGPFEPFVACGFTDAEVAALGRHPRPIGVLGKVISDGEVLRLPDLREHPAFRGLPPEHPPLGAFLGVPVRREGRGAGNLYLARRPDRPPFTEEDQHMVELLAAQAAVSTQNARLYRDLEQERTRAQLLADASARMVGSLDFETTLEQAANAVLPSFADLCVLHVADERGDLTRRVVAAADPAWHVAVRDLAVEAGRPPGSHPAWKVLRELRPASLRIDAATLDSMFAGGPRAAVERLPIKHGIFVPMAGRERTLGVLGFFRFQDTAFDDRDLLFAQELARRAALSIDNAILHKRTRRAVQARDDLLAIVSHDLRNPLNSIRIGAQLLAANPGLDEAKRLEVGSRIARTTDRMTRLIAGLLDASKIESGTFKVETKPERVDRMFDDAIEMFREAAAAKSIALTSSIGPRAGEVRCDRDRILEVLSNLIGNALKFTPSGGRIALGGEASGGEVRISVRDSGPGIPEAQRQLVFDRYWQASHSSRGGAGLGLFIVQGIVEAHGGRAWAEGAPEGGACLSFTLPGGAPSGIG